MAVPGGAGGPLAGGDDIPDHLLQASEPRVVVAIDVGTYGR